MGPNLPGFSRSCLILSLPGGFGLTGRFSLFPVMNLSWRSFALGRAGLAGVGCTWPSLTWPPPPFGQVTEVEFLARRPIKHAVSPWLASWLLYGEPVLSPFTLLCPNTSPILFDPPPGKLVFSPPPL